MFLCVAKSRGYVHQCVHQCVFPVCQHPGKLFKHVCRHIITLSLARLRDTSQVERTNQSGVISSELRKKLAQSDDTEDYIRAIKYAVCCLLLICKSLNGPQREPSYTYIIA